MTPVHNAKPSFPPVAADDPTWTRPDPRVVWRRYYARIGAKTPETAQERRLRRVVAQVHAESLTTEAA